MARFYRFETIDIPLEFTPEGVLNNYKHIVVSIAQDGIVQIDKTEDDMIIDVENDKIIVSLSQEETGKFISGNEKVAKAKIQVNIYYENSERDVSAVETIDVYDNLYKKVIADE